MAYSSQAVNDVERGLDSPPLAVVTFKWHNPQYAGKFASEHVNILRNMVARHYHAPHRFICFTDDPAGIDSDIETYPLWDDHANVPNPTGGGRPACYRRLKLFDPSIAEIIGPRFVALDLDTIITGDLHPLFDRTEEVVMWRCPSGEWPYNGALFMMNTGARPQVWNTFDPVESPKLTTKAGYRGSDQAWISLCLGWNEAAWTELDGVYWLQPSRRGRLPTNARIVFTTGLFPPWEAKEPWIREHYR